MASVVYGTPHWQIDLYRNYLLDGVCVIEDVYTAEQCEDAVSDVVDAVECLGTDVSRNDPSTWTTANLPSRVRAGMMQSTVNNRKSVWDARCNPRIYEIFHCLYDRLRSRDPGPLVTSIDGINLKPPGVKPFHKAADSRIDPDDWAHLDQTDRVDKWKCIQGQLVLTNTTACFRASPGSHRVFSDLLDHAGVDSSDKTNWHMFAKERFEQYADIVEAQGGKWQVPIRAPRGSFIVWSSATVHSAQFAEENEQPVPGDAFSGWRAVFYICLRPAADFYGKDGKLSQSFIDRRKNIIDANRCTNHWSNHVFPPLLGGRHANKVKHHDRIHQLHKDLSLAYRWWEMESPWNREDVKRMNGFA